MNEKKDIVKSNALIEACYNPSSVWQMRLLLAALMQVKSSEELTHTKNFIITANSLADLTNSNSKGVANYRELRKASKELSRTVITVQEKPNGEIGSPDETDINITGSCRYYKNEGKVSLRFNAEIIPYISSLKNRFTKYQAKYVMPMRSSYGIRLYELCLQWLGEERELSVNDFKKMFGLENKYQRIEVLKRRVINPALEDINTHSDIHVDFGQRKSGRTITHFKFLFTRKNRPHKLTKKYIEQNARPGESWEDAKNRLKFSLKQE